MKYWYIVLSLVLVFFGATSVAQTKTDPLISSMNVTQLKELMSQQGYTVTEAPDSDRALTWMIDGIKLIVIIGDDRDTLQVFVGFGDDTFTLRQMNDWNQKHRFGRAYLNDNGKPCLEMDLSLVGGVSRAHVNHYFRLSNYLLVAFMEAIKQ